MRRRTSFLLFGFLSASLLGYVAWCCRPFVSKPPLGVAKDIPDDATEAIRLWYREDGYFVNRSFTWSALISCLQNPWEEPAKAPAMARWVEDLTAGSIFVHHPSSHLGVVFVRSDGMWIAYEKVPPSEIWRRENEASRRIDAMKLKILKTTPFVPEGIF